MMNMSIPYELTGRRRQKARSRNALVAAARQLLAEGITPTVEQAADRAEVSRTTAYRYFPTRRVLLAATYPEIEAGSQLGTEPPSDPLERLDLVTEAITRQVVEHEPELRAQLRLSLEPRPPDPEDLPFRRGRALAGGGGRHHALLGPHPGPGRDRRDALEPAPGPGPLSARTAIPRPHGPDPEPIRVRGTAASEVRTSGRCGDRGGGPAPAVEAALQPRPAADGLASVPVAATVSPGPPGDARPFPSLRVTPATRSGLSSGTACPAEDAAGSGRRAATRSDVRRVRSGASGRFPRRGGVGGRPDLERTHLVPPPGASRRGRGFAGPPPGSRARSPGHSPPEPPGGPSAPDLRRVSTGSPRRLPWRGWVTPGARRSAGPAGAGALGTRHPVRRGSSVVGRSLLQAADQVRHLDGRLRRLGPLVVGRPRSGEGLVPVEGGEHAERAGDAGVEVDVHHPVGAALGHELEVRRLPLDHAAQGDHGVHLPRLGQGQRGQRDLQRSRHPHHLRVAAATTLQRLQGTAQQPPRDLLVVPGHHDRDAQLARVQVLRPWLLVAAFSHRLSVRSPIRRRASPRKATRYSRCPSFSFLVRR